MQKKLVADCSDAELRKFASEVVGIPGITENHKGAALKQKFKAAWPHDYILTAEAGPEPLQKSGLDNPPPVAPPAEPQMEANVPPRQVMDGITQTSSKHDPIVWLMIAETAEPGGKDDVYSSVNGSAMLIPRNKFEPVPYRYYLAIKNAVQNIVEQDPKTLNYSEHSVPRYNISLDPEKPMPSAAEIKAWHRSQLALCGQVAA